MTTNKTPCQIAVDALNKKREDTERYREERFLERYGKEWTDILVEDKEVEACGMIWIKYHDDWTGELFIYNKTHKSDCWSLTEIGKVIEFHQEYIKQSWWGKLKMNFRIV